MAKPRTTTITVGSRAVVLAVAMVAALSAAGPIADADVGASPAGGGRTVLVRPNAVVVLASLPVKGRAPMTGYSRAAYGQAWYDLNRDGCGERDNILQRDLTQLTFKPGTRDCVVLSGRLADRYTGKVIAFRKSQASAVQVDHVVALADSWQKGAQRWDAAKRLTFANDPLNLLAVDGPANQRKGASDAASWLPPNKAYRCAYVARQVAVKAKYGLWVTGAEKAAVARVLIGCPRVVLPRGGAALPRVTAPGVVAPTTPAPAASPSGPVSGEVYYENCAAARAAGAAALRRGHPGYREAMDGDRDGVACET